MSATTIHIKTDTKTRDEAAKVAKEFGFGSLTSLVNVLLKQIARTKRLSLNIEEKPTPYLIGALRQSEDDARAGEVISFDKGADALNYLVSEVYKDISK
jgi:antitoxin component of RelBE/YafQ-DinJ toxin-antitoxin module